MVIWLQSNHYQMHLSSKLFHKLSEQRGHGYVPALLSERCRRNNNLAKRKELTTNRAETMFINNLATTKKIPIPKGLTRVSSLNKVVRTMDIQNAKASLGKLCEPDAQFILFNHVKHPVTGWKFYCLVPKTITYHCLYNGYQDFVVTTVMKSVDSSGFCVGQVLTGA